MSNQVKMKTRSMAIILYYSFLISIRMVFYFYKLSLKLLAKRLRTPGRTGTTIRSIASMFSISVLCSYLLCSSGSLGNVKGFAHLSSLLFLWSNVSVSLNNIPVRVFMLYLKAGVCSTKNIWVSQVITWCKWLTEASCLYAAPTQSSDNELIRRQFTDIFLFWEN